MKKHNGAIDFLKFLFALMIVIYHGRLFADAETPLFRAGKIGVEFFFIVSGYLMAAKAETVSQQANLQVGSETSSYILKKVKSLLPHTLLAFAIIWIVTGIFHNNHETYLKNSVYSIWEVSLLWMSGLGTTLINRQTWYLSSMLLSMLILYPLAISNFERFTKTIALAISVFFLGWIAYAQGALSDSKDTVWTGITHTGNVRAIAEISLGCVCYQVAKKLQSLNFTNIGRNCLSALEILCYGLVVLGATTKEQKLLFVLIPIISVAVTITFSQQSALNSLFNKKIFYWLGSFSTVLYLNHMVVRTVVINLKLQMSYWKQLAIYLLFSILLSLFCMYLVKGLQLLWKKHGNKITRLFIVNSAN